MPCYEPENVDAQRGKGVFDASIRALQLLNQLGCGRQDDFVLDLVYNPNGAFLPPNQAELEPDYKRELVRLLLARVEEQHRGSERMPGQGRDAFSPCPITRS
jgi:hypothetical protein